MGRREGHRRGSRAGPIFSIENRRRIYTSRNENHRAVGTISTMKNFLPYRVTVVAEIVRARYSVTDGLASSHLGEPAHE